MAGTVEKPSEKSVERPTVTDEKAKEAVDEIIAGLYQINLEGSFTPKGHKGSPIEILYARRPTQTDLIYFRDMELRFKNRLAREIDEDGKRAWYWQAEIEKDLEVRGLWTVEDRKELQGYQDETIKAILDLRNAATDGERKDSQDRFEQARTKWVLKISKLYAYLDGSIEVQSKARTQLYRMQRLIVHVNGKDQSEPVWSKTEDIFSEEQIPQFKKIAEEFVRIERGYDEDFLGSW